MTNFDSLKHDRLRRSIRLMTAREIFNRMSQVNHYLSSITPKVSRYRELRMERDLLRERYNELTKPTLL